MTKTAQLSTRGIMLRVVAALVPGIAVVTYVAGIEFLLVFLVATLGCLATELTCTRNPKLLLDGSALVTGALIALCLPPTTPLYVTLIAAVLAIALAKHAFGGLGQNLFNPAMVGYAIVLVAFPQQLVYFDAKTGATALDLLAHRGAATLAEISIQPAFGAFGASGFEWTNLAFLVGGIYLLASRIVGWQIPLGVLLGIAVPAVFFYDGGSSNSLGSPLFHCFAGGTMLAAFFIATDPVSSPSHRNYQFLYGFFIGSCTLAIRTFGAWPDGFAFAVLLANLLVPLLERLGNRRLRPKTV